MRVSAGPKSGYNRQPFPPVATRLVLLTLRDRIRIVTALFLGFSSVYPNPVPDCVMGWEYQCGCAVTTRALRALTSNGRGPKSSGRMITLVPTTA